jgi:hypothetical protein
MTLILRQGAVIVMGMLVLWVAPGCGSGTAAPDGGLSGFAGTGGGAGGSGGPGASGIASSKRIDQLTQTEKATLCDWGAQEFGGYGTVMNCGNGTTLESNANQAECLAAYPTGSCPATVAQYEVCVSEISCANIIPDSCAPLLLCTSGGG